MSTRAVIIRFLSTLAAAGAVVAMSAPASGTTPAATPTADSRRFSLAAGASLWASPVDAWEYETAFLGTALGSRGEVRHEGGWEVRAVLNLRARQGGTAESAASHGLDLELGYGQDRLTLTEYLAPVHVGTSRQYGLGQLTRQRLTARLGTGLVLRQAAPRLEATLCLGLVDAQFNTFTVDRGDRELPGAVGGALDVTAGDTVLFFNPLELDLYVDLTGRVFVLLGCGYDRLEAPLSWSIADATVAAGPRDQLALAVAVFHAGAGFRW